MWAEFFELKSGDGVTFEIKGAHLIGSDVRIQGPDEEWYTFMRSLDPDFEWSMGGRDWIDFAVANDRMAGFSILPWEEAKKFLREDS